MGLSEETRRGSIYWVDFNPARGSELRGTRPALVVQNDIGNRFSRTTIIAAITTAEADFPFMVRVTPSESGLPKLSWINLSQIRTIDKARFVQECGELSTAKMRQVDEALKISLGLESSE